MQLSQKLVQSEPFHHFQENSGMSLRGL